MPKLELTVATANYDRVRALIDGRVGIEGCTINYLILKVEEVLERAYLHHEFDIAEIGFSPYLIALSRGIAPYVAAPAFLSRIFRGTIAASRGSAISRASALACPNIRCRPRSGCGA